MMVVALSLVLLALACSSSSSGSPSNGATACLALGQSCDPSNPSAAKCCGVCRNGTCAKETSVGDACTVDSDCNEGYCLPLVQADAGASDGGSAKACFFGCAAKDNGNMTCGDRDENGDYSAAYLCNGTAWVALGKCKACSQDTPDPISDAVDCDHEHVNNAVAGYPCLKDGSVACTVDFGAYLFCKGGTWQVKEQCTGLRVCGTVPQGSPGCAAPQGCTGCKG